MKLLLIRQTNAFYRYSNTSYGLGLIGTLAKEFAAVKIIDNNCLRLTYSIKDILKIIADFKPDVIGFNVQAFNILATKKLIAAISREFPGICLLGGGLHTQSRPREVADLGVHIVAKGEADLIIRPLLKAFQAVKGEKIESFRFSDSCLVGLRKIPGLLFKRGLDEWEDTGEADILYDLDSLPFVDYDLFNLNDYLKSSGDSHFVTNVLITQRGCPFKCPFCQGKESNRSNTVRENSLEYKIEYLGYLYDRYKPSHFVFYDNNFTLNRQATIDFCRSLVKSPFYKRFTFSCQTNVVIPLDDELLSALKAAGCSEVGLGIERLSEDSLRLIRKNKNYQTIRYNIKMLNKHGIDVMANCLVGFPFDTPQTIRQERRLFEEALADIKVFAINNLIPVPGTEIYEETPRKDWYLDEDVMSYKPSFYHMVYNYTNNAWDVNYFGLSEETQEAIGKIKEHFYDITISKINSRFINFLHALEKIIAPLSLKLYRLSPLTEDIVFFFFKRIRLKLRNYFLVKYYLKRG
ncbi:MAG: B12-binding domain-containing radical SAM protein [Candidatus Omnitrophica bacterium]|nr:B12-binding domain-containing radical SAM protein [Candidatus Omnitrophota bacterium]